jgi:anti-anti-sigma factor
VDFRVERDGDHRFRLFGELDMANASDLFRQLERAAQQDGDLRLDLSQLTFMDSTGVHVLVRLADRCASGHRIVVEGPTAQVARLFELVGAESYPNVVIRNGRSQEASSKVD